MRFIFLSFVSLILVSCVHGAYEGARDACRQETGFNGSHDNFYEVQEKKKLNAYYNCIKAKPNLSETDLLVMNMQQSLWNQRLDKTISAAQAQEKYINFMQGMENNTTVTTTAAPAYRPIMTTCRPVGSFMHCSGF